MEKEKFREWMRKIKDFEGGLLGFYVILATVVATGFGAWYGLNLFMAGTYPMIILAIPALISGGIFFLITARITFKFIKERD